MPSLNKRKKNSRLNFTLFFCFNFQFVKALLVNVFVCLSFSLVGQCFLTHCLVFSCSMLGAFSHVIQCNFIPCLISLIPIGQS
jgi:hypothetical protein